MTYRPDIDGLRAIAILFVLIYHGGLSLFPSGFIGVDVFFVISGFLITQIITRSLENNSFSFIDFYNRRLWRLQPVFIIFLLVATVSTYLLFLPDDLIEYSRSARKSSLFMANNYFNHTTTGYFSPDVLQLPLLHTWSLSIEWQCYLLLPLGMYGLHRLVKKQLLWVIAALTMVLLGYSWYSAGINSAQVYYQLSNRMFEFLIGSMIALLPVRSIHTSPFFVNTMGFIALTVLFYCAHLQHILIGYPNGYALLVCSATAVLIALGTYAPKHNITRLLSVRPLVFVGLLSYSLYLWHWLVFSLLRYEHVAETSGTLIACYAIIVLGAYLSWRYIEKPARTLYRIKLPHTVILLLVTPIVLTHFNSYFVKDNSGFPQRFNQELVTIYQQLQQYGSKRRPLCISRPDVPFETQCLIGTEHAAKKGLLIGDSFSNHYWGLVDTLGKSAGVSITALGTSSCITLPGIYLYDWWTFKGRVYQECFAQTKRYYQMIQHNHYDYVLIGQAWSNYLGNHIVTDPKDERSTDYSKKRLSHALNQGLKIITSTGATPVLIKSTAQPPTNTHDCFYQHIKKHQNYDPKQCNFTLVENADELWLNTLFNAMQVKYPQLILLDPKDIQCTQGLCTAELNGVPVYRDAGHITDYASYYIGKAYLQKYGNPLFKTT